jgi:hypothetical protein
MKMQSAAAPTRPMTPWLTGRKIKFIFYVTCAKITI